MIRSEFLKGLIVEAGNSLKNLEPRIEVYSKGETRDMVTSADLECESFIVKSIQSSYPEDLILSEETYPKITRPLSVPRLWVVDPLDGTLNFKNGRNYFSVAIAYVERGVTKIGAIYNPSTNELFFSESGSGAFLNDKRISVSEQIDLSSATVATDNGYEPAVTRVNLAKLLGLRVLPWILIKGSATLAMAEVASGRMDLYFHTDLKPWDNAAGFQLTTEAGGQVVDLGGKAVSFLSSTAVVGNRQLIKRFLTGSKN